MHKLLSRLVRRHLPKDIDQNLIQNLLASLSECFNDHDEDRYMLERSLMLMSEELNEINATLQSQLVENEDSKKQLEENLVKQTALLDATPEAVISFKPGGEVNQMNRAGLDLMGISEAEFRANSGEKNLEIWLGMLVDPRCFVKDLDRIRLDQSLELHDYVDMKDGRYFAYHSVPEFLNGKYLGRVWCWRDLSNMKNHQEKLKYQAFHDSLTTLPNRMFILESLHHAITLGKRNGSSVAVMFIDLDDFKKINDTAGHDIGDRFLVEVSRKLGRGLRESDILGRLGGDEFLIILEGIEHSYQIDQVRDCVLGSLREPVVIDNTHYVVSCSVGVSLFPSDGDKPEELIRKADMAMYQAKEQGKNTFRYFDPSLERIAIHRMAIETKLREGIAKEEFSLVYQPKICLQKKNTVHSVEALIRWIRPDGEIIYPDQFIAVAENIGLIQSVTLWVLRTACMKLKAWQATPLESLSISINISAMDLRSHSFASAVMDVINDYGVDPAKLELELTESVLLDEKCEARENMARLRASKVKLSVDDFGTSYSNFAYLQELDIDFLKIDRSFVAGVDKNQKSAAIVKSIIDIGENLGITCVAEGVETALELAHIKQMGCAICQGYYYSRPLSEADLLAYMNNNHVTV